MVNIFAVGAGGILVDHWSTISSSVYYMGFFSQIDGLGQDCSISSALAMELLQSCTKLS